MLIKDQVTNNVISPGGILPGRRKQNLNWIISPHDRCMYYCTNGTDRPDPGEAMGDTNSDGFTRYAFIAYGNRSFEDKLRLVRTGDRVRCGHYDVTVESASINEDQDFLFVNPIGDHPLLLPTGYHYLEVWRPNLVLIT